MVYLYKNTLLKINFVFCLNRFLKSAFDLILIAILSTLKTTSKIKKVLAF